jgi:predicted Zn-dependent protease with MMP-like domain
LEALPPHFQAAAENVVVVVEPYPAPEDYGSAAERQQARKTPLYGVYRGVPLPLRIGAPLLSTPDVIALFQRPLLAGCRTSRDLREEIRLTVLHEMGHYFGLEEPAVEHL